MSLPRTVTQAEFGAEVGRFETLIRSVDPPTGIVRADVPGGRPATSPSTSSGSSPTSSPAGSTGSAATKRPSARSTSASGSDPTRWPTSSPRSRPSLAGLLALVRRRRVVGSVAERHRHARSKASRRCGPTWCCTPTTSGARLGRDCAGRRGPDSGRSRTSRTSSPSADGGRRRSRSTACRAFDVSGGGDEITGAPWPSSSPRPAEATPALGLDETANIYGVVPPLHSEVATSDGRQSVRRPRSKPTSPYD